MIDLVIVNDLKAKKIANAFAIKPENLTSFIRLLNNEIATNNKSEMNLFADDFCYCIYEIHEDKIEPLEVVMCDEVQKIWKEKNKE